MTQRFPWCISTRSSRRFAAGRPRCGTPWIEFRDLLTYLPPPPSFTFRGSYQP